MSRAFTSLLFLLAISFSTFIFGVNSAWAQADSLKTPNISANALFLYRSSDFAKQDDSTTRNGLDIQEAEVQFYSDVDPYTKFNFVLTVAPEYDFDATTKQVTQKWNVSPEELWAESLQIPDVTLRIGKMKAPMGKHNQLHTHAYPFVDAPLINTIFLGDEGFAEAGVSAAWLMPTPWYSELTGEYLRQGDQNPEFNSPSSGDGIGVAHWKNLVDLNDSSTIEAGISGAQGKNYLRGSTNIEGADLTYKWRPISGGKYHSGILAAEYMHRGLTQPLASQNQDGTGYVVWGQYQLAERWTSLLRYEEVNIVGSDATADPLHFISNGKTQKGSASVVFAPSEFSSYRLEYDQTHGPAQVESGLTTDHKIYFQANFTIGSHPAHSY